LRLSVGEIEAVRELSGTNINIKQLMILGASTVLASPVFGLAVAEEMRGQYLQI
jgi:hypothetical protein